MSYLISRRQPVPAEIRHVLTDETGRALDALDHWRDKPRESVHRARQSFKRVRALLRLVRPSARYVFRMEDEVFRGMARSLAGFRDGDAVVDALDGLAGSLAGPRTQESLRMLRASLEQRAVRSRLQDANALEERVTRAREALGAARLRFGIMPIEGLRRRDLRRGVTHTQANGRMAFAAALATRGVIELHDWRRQVKYACHHCRLMAQLMPEWCARYGPGLDDLADRLGRHHDLVILEQLLRGEVDDLGIDTHLRAILNLAREARLGLAEAALAAGSRHYGGAAPDDNVVAFRAPA